MEVGARNVFRSHAEMSENRELRKLLEKETWYYDREESQPLENLGSQNPRWQARGSKFFFKKHLTTEKKRYQPSSVKFIPRSESGKLITALRMAEENLKAVSTGS